MASKRRTVVLVALVALLLLVGGGLWWVSWTRSPRFALRAIGAALQSQDRYAFERYVDVDSVIQSVLSDYVADNPFAAMIANASAPAIRKQVQQAVEDRTLNQDSIWGGALGKLITAEVHNIQSLGPNAYVHVPITTESGVPFTLRIHMAKLPEGHWRVDRITNLKELVAVERSEQLARAEKRAQQIELQLSDLVIVARLHTSVGEDWRRINRFQIRFQNNTPKRISSVSVRIHSDSADYSVEVVSDLNIDVGETKNGLWDIVVNRFDRATERMFDLGEVKYFEVKILAIEFEDGTALRSER